MPYTPAEKQKIDRILIAFQPFIQPHTFFDLVYSEKIGYVHLWVEDAEDEGAVVIRSADHLLQVLFHELTLDYLLSPDSAESDWDGSVSPGQRGHPPRDTAPAGPPESPRGRAGAAGTVPGPVPPALA